MRYVCDFVQQTYLIVAPTAQEAREKMFHIVTGKLGDDDRIRAYLVLTDEIVEAVVRLRESVKMFDEGTDFTSRTAGLCACYDKAKILTLLLTEDI